MMESEIRNLFVYGTLKSTGSNRHLLDRFSFTSAFARGMELHDSPGFPFAYYGDGTVFGEVYFNLDLRSLRTIDRLEGVPDLYTRELVSAEVVGTPGPVVAWIYISREAMNYPIITGGIWK
jgi:gamma-glutamylcyclotransferase (GGCT)/AIG2-like uncharacterized protein YtfP